MANTYIQRTITSNGNARTWTYSFWVKRSKLGTWMNTHNLGGTANRDYLGFDANDKIDIGHYDGGYQYNLVTNRKFRDTNGWYHIVITMDTTQATSSNRIKLYVNGVQETSFSTATYPSQNHNTRGSQDKIMIGADFDPSNYFDGSISHVNFVDGTAYDASYFGSTDSTTGEWKINTAPSVTYGTNGCFILKDGNSVTDQSGNGNNFTVGGGTLTNTEDCPSNVFATLNPLHPSLNTARVFTNGNTTMELGGTGRVPEVSTLGMTSGKFYAEMKDVGGTGGKSIMGITGQMRRASNIDWLGSKIYDYSYYSDVGNKANNASETSFGDSWTNGDIIGVAVDLDNLKIYFSKNGVWQNSGDPTSGATGTGSAFTITAPSSTVDGAYFFACGDDNAYASRTMSWNFGNGYFGTTAVSSAGTNASGIGIFEYDVPTGYTALSTKGLNE